jgi:GNAT superfamily N-acetyltransferase
MTRRNGHAAALESTAPVAAEMPVNLTVRPAVRSDLRPLGFFFDTVLRRDYFLRRGQLTEMLHGPHHQLYVAEIDTILVGVAITTRHTRLVNVLVHPGYRGLGIGPALLGHANVREVRVKTNMSTGDPRAFYRRLGYRGAGRDPSKPHIEIMRLPETARGARRRSAANAG